MRYWIGVTDKDWFHFLSSRQPDEVNFWQPSGKPVARFLEPGIPFLFKLHSPHNFIVGGGFFVRFSVLPARLAWDMFRENNGTADYRELRDRLARYRESGAAEPEIGCNVLNAPFFWPQSEWIPVPESWAPHIVRGKTFDTDQSDGAALWHQVQARLQARPFDTPEAQGQRYGAEYLARARLGQGAFRVLVTDAYDRRCAITGERTLPVLQAAHIRPYAQQGPHLVSNGLLLRSDLHTLFDQGYLTVTDEYVVEVSKRIREEFANGKEYYKHHGSKLVVLPGRDAERPSREYLRWHSGTLFKG